MSADETTSADHGLSLAGQLVGISISDSEDLARRGFLPLHVDRALAEVATGLAAAGARIGYGGHLEAGGFTHKLFRAVSELYGRREMATPAPPCVHYLAFPLWRRLPPAQLLDHIRAMGGAIEVVLIGLDGHARSLRLLHDETSGSAPAIHFATRQPRRLDGIDLHTSPLYRCVRTWWSEAGISALADSEPEKAPGDTDASPDGGCVVRSASDVDRLLEGARRRTEYSAATAFSAMRLFMAADEDARVVLGGKTHGYAGHFPGIAEETLYSLLAGNPVVGLRCFGGCADEVVETLLTGVHSDRLEAGRGSGTVLRALAAGAGVFRDALEQAELADFYAKVAGIDSSRALAIGVLRCLERLEWHRAWHRRVGAFRSAILSSPV